MIEFDNGIYAIWVLIFVLYLGLSVSCAIVMSVSWLVMFGVRASVPVRYRKKKHRGDIYESVGLLEAYADADSVSHQSRISMAKGVSYLYVGISSPCQLLHRSSS